MSKKLPSVVFVPTALAFSKADNDQWKMVDGAVSAMDILEKRGIDVVIYPERHEFNSHMMNAVIARMGTVRRINSPAKDLVCQDALVFTTDKQVKNSIPAEADALVVFVEPSTRDNYCELLSEVKRLVAS